MKKVGICGYYGEGPEFEGGQPVKVKSLIKELETALGGKDVGTISTYNWRKKPFKLVKNCLYLAKDSENIIVLPASNGVKVIIPLFLLLNLFMHRKIHYVVIGAWLSDLLNYNKFLYYLLKRVDCIYVETHKLENELKEKEFDNLVYMPNFKRLVQGDIYDEEYYSNGVLRYCTFSRILKEKGIEDAINAITSINKKANKEICSLDIYGPIDSKYENDFFKLMKNVPNYINYKGLVSPNESTKILQDYYMQLFPTKFKTEGVPGSIIDSYFSGLPVLASKWESFDDVIENGITGIGFEFDNYDDFSVKLTWSVNNSSEVYKMRTACIRKAENYRPEKVIGDFITYLQ